MSLYYSTIEVIVQDAYFVRDKVLKESYGCVGKTRNSTVDSLGYAVYHYMITLLPHPIQPGWWKTNSKNQ